MMDETLIPPYAFLESPSSRFELSNSKSSNIGFENFLVPVNNQMNNFSQTNNVRSINKASLTTETFITQQDLKEKFNIKKSKYLEEINSLKKQNHAKITDLNHAINDLNKQLSESNLEKIHWQEQLEKMKLYIHGIENREVWLQEKQRLIKQIEELEIQDNEKQVMIESLGIQLSNMEKIQFIQERELVKNIVKFNEQKLLPNEIRYESILRTWRHKVLSLLIQQESTDVLIRNEKQKIKVKIEENQKEIDHLRNTLEAANLKLQLNEAQLTIKDTTIEKLKRKNGYLQTQVDTKNQEQIINSQCIEDLSVRFQQFKNIIEKDAEIKFQKASVKCDGLQRRLDFALSRFPVIRANIVRSKNVTMPCENANDLLNNTIPVNGIELRIMELQDALLISNREMEQLKSERDGLIVSLEQDSATFQQRVNDKKQELHEELSNLQSMVEQLEQSLIKTRQELEIVKNENSRMKSRYEELLTEKYNETENLQVALSEIRTDNSKLLLEFAEYKRSSSSDKMKLKEKARKCEDSLKECEDLWLKKMQQLEAECNLLKITIRQEGILSKLKARPEIKKSKESIIDYETENVLREVEHLTDELRISGDCD